MDLKRGIEKAYGHLRHASITTAIASPARSRRCRKPVAGDMSLAQVGTISANNDETIGKIIAEAMDKVGKDGVITVEESKTMET